MDALAIGPFKGATLALKLTNLLGDSKGEFYTDSLSAIMGKAIDAASYPDTVVYVYECDNDGTMRPTPFARVQRDGVGDVKYYELEA